MAGLRRSFRWPLENKKTLTLAVPKSESGFGFTVAWTKPPLVDYIHEGGNAEKAGLMPGDKIMCIDKIKVSKKGREEIESIVKNVKDIMELEIIRPESELATRKRQTSLRRKESFTKKGSKMIIQDCNIMLWRRERAILKLLLCEEDLLRTIHLGKERFILVLRKHCNLATTMELNILFGNIEEVASVQERYVQQLRQMTQGNEDCVGRLYQKQVCHRRSSTHSTHEFILKDAKLDDRCSALKTYVYGIHLSKILLKYKMTNKLFKEFIEDQEKIEDATLEISKFIEKPIQYIADIATQLETLLSCTAVGHRDYICLESVLTVFQNFSKEMNDAVEKLSCLVDLDNVSFPYRDEDPYVNLEVLQEKSIFTKGPRNFSLVHPGRYWLFSGELSKIEGRHYIQYWALLLSDCFILTRRTEQRVLLVLDEPVLLRSIYQATFDVKKCDTEFRILFALEKPKKLSGIRNQWQTWIFRAPSVGIKLLWQTILTYQLSMYSTEALNSGTKASFVHARPLPGVKQILSKTSSKYEESSFVTVAEGSELPAPKAFATSSFIAESNDKEFGNIQPRVNKFILPLAKRAEILKDISARKRKECSYFSLNENIIASNVDDHEFPRSKSFGNDFGDSIPFIDSADENFSQKNGSYYNEALSVNTTVQKRAVKNGKFQSRIVEEDKYPTEVASAPGTPQKTDRYVQTDDSSQSSAKPSPKRRFPRLGTFERIKVEKKISSEPNTPTPTSPKHTTRTGTSLRHRRHIKTTVSKELLLKSSSGSPTKDEKGVLDLPEHSEPNTTEKKKSKGIFSRLFKRDTKATRDKKAAAIAVEVQMSNLKDISNSEHPPDYESAVRSSNTSWVSS